MKSVPGVFAQLAVVSMAGTMLTACGGDSTPQRAAVEPQTVPQVQKDPRLEALEQAALARFIVNDDGTVTDTREGLIWMRCSLGQTWSGDTCIGDPRQLNWDQALRAAAEFSHGGVDDWRLPTQPELYSLTYCSTGMRSERNRDGLGGGCVGDYRRPTILEPVFPNTPSGNFWTSTPHERFAFSAWGVAFHTGHTGTGGRTDYVHVRLVRDARS